MNGVLYVYHIGLQDGTYGVNEKENVDVYSIDLTKDNPELVKEYEINKNGEYVYSAIQDENAIYYISYAWKESAGRYNSKIYKFVKKTKEIKEVYDFNEYSLPGASIGTAIGVFKIYNNKIFVTDLFAKKLYSIDLNENSSKTITEEAAYSYINYRNKVTQYFSDYSSKKFRLEVLNLDDLSITNKVEENAPISQYYSINNKLIYLVDGTYLKISGDKNYEIDLSQYVDGMNKNNKGYNDLYLWDNYTVKVSVSVDGKSAPEYLSVDLNTGKVEKTTQPDGTSKNSHTFLYIK